jgi:glycosyltransferase involved in cell wall biosynthesis
MMILSTQPLVSCIIPTRNRSKLLRKAIESVFSQTYKNIELIVINDASEDDTDTAVKRYMNLRKNFKYSRSPVRLGESGARNAGILLAAGDFIAFLDDDDRWMRHKIEEQLKIGHQFDAVLCAYFDTRERKPVIFKSSMITAADVRRNIGFAINSCMFVKSAILKKFRYDEKLVYAPDLDLLVRISHDCSIGYAGEVLAVVNTGDHNRITNQVVDMTLPQMETRLRVFQKHKEFFGPFWFRYHQAEILLSLLRKRKNKIPHVWYTVKRCGLLPVLNILWKKRCSAVSKKFRPPCPDPPISPPLA